MAETCDALSSRCPGPRPRRFGEGDVTVIVIFGPEPETKSEPPPKKRAPPRKQPHLRPVPDSARRASLPAAARAGTATDGVGRRDALHELPTEDRMPRRRAGPVEGARSAARGSRPDSGSPAASSGAAPGSASSAARRRTCASPTAASNPRSGPRPTGNASRPAGSAEVTAAAWRAPNAATPRGMSSAASWSSGHRPGPSGTVSAACATATGRRRRPRWTARRRCARSGW